MLTSAAMSCLHLLLKGYEHVAPASSAPALTSIRTRAIKKQIGANEWVKGSSVSSCKQTFQPTHGHLWDGSLPIAGECLLGCKLASR